MDNLIFNGITYSLAINGLNISENSLIATIVDHGYDFEEIENTVGFVEIIKQVLEDGTQIASYKGYTKLMSVNKLFNQVIDQEAHTEEKAVPKVDPETGRPIIDSDTGEPEMESIAVTNYTPIYGDVYVVTLLQPVLEDTVAEQGKEIEEIQEVIMEMIEG